MNPRLRAGARWLAARLGLYWPTWRERRALEAWRLAQAVRLRGRPGRLALVGCGAMGTTIATAALAHLPGWEVSALYDLREEAMQAVGAAWPKAARAADREEFLARAREADVVAIATTSDAHADLARGALQAGAEAVLVEKPVTTCLAEADDLIAAAGRSRARVAVDHTRRWLPSVEGLRRLLGSGAIGAVRALHFVYGWGGFGMIGTHLFDLARCLAGSDLGALRARLDERGPARHGPRFRDPSGFCEARFASGARLTVDLSEDLRLRQMFYVIVGSLGRVEVDERLGRVRLVGSGGRAWEAEYVFPEAVPLGVARALFELREGRPPRCTLEDGRAALEAAVACHLSARADGAWVSLPVGGAAREERFPFA